MKERFQFNLKWPEVFVLEKLVIAGYYDLPAGERGVIDGVLKILRDCEMVHLRNGLCGDADLKEESLSFF